MARKNAKSIWMCSACGNEYPQWVGTCRCGAANTVKEVSLPSSGGGNAKAWLGNAVDAPTPLADVSESALGRIALPIEEVNRVLGGGIVPGSVVLMAGEPGIGKSTLLLQIAGAMARDVGQVLYVSGEESAEQVRRRADRLGTPLQRLLFLGETNVDAVLRQLENMRPALAVVDSVQTLYTDDSRQWDAASAPSSSPGTTTQVRECTRRLLQWAKERQTPVLLAGHVTKEGDVAGPRVLEHMVDVVLGLEGDALSAFRLLRCTKNRFGSTNEVGVFQMEGHGLVEVADPSRMLVSQRQREALGSTVAPVLEGTRPLLVEVQALTSPSGLPAPRRLATGIDNARLVMLAAVLAQRAGVPLSGQDVIVNIAGGLRVKEPAVDLAVALAVASSVRGRPVGGDLVAVGEVGLSGELRTVPQLERRLREAARLGFTRAIVPQLDRAMSAPPGLELLPAATLTLALRHLFPQRAQTQASWADVLREDQEAAAIIERAIAHEAEGADNEARPGWEWHEVGASPATLRSLLTHGLLRVAGRTNNTTYYRLADANRSAQALESRATELTP